jgi:hypothetical protein
VILGEAIAGDGRRFLKVFPQEITRLLRNLISKGFTR